MSDEKDQKYADLHVHTNYSDGSFSPKEAVDYAKSAGLSAISITDHDTVEGVPPAAEEGKKAGVEIIPGVELSCEVEDAQRSELHMLGYFINVSDPTLIAFLAAFRQSRIERAEKINRKLEDIGIHIDRELLGRIAGHGSIGRLHFSKAMVEMGITKTIAEAFQKYLSSGKPAFVPKFKLSPEDAIKLVRDAGGVPVLAHPYYMHYSDRKFLKDLVTAGLAGIEVWHSRHTRTAEKTFKQMANDLHLVATGGSDCHGPYGKEPPLMGSVKVPYSVVTELEKRIERVSA